MKTLQVESYHGEYGEGDAYYADGVLISFIDHDDANWRHEYFNPIMEKLGIKVEEGVISDEQLNQDIEELRGG